ncbi:hypothetical protein M3Y94_00258200 [Aphelenchoides besseyi]|nr:hypothetical protein M3Y94_00258200 [Aphelenchoides besseyi]
MFNRGMEIAVRVHDARLDSTESALLLHFLILSGARDQFPLNNTLNEHINKLMKETFRYYEENYREARVRFGNLLLLFYHFNEVESHFRELAQMLSLCGYRSVIPRNNHENALR